MPFRNLPAPQDHGAVPTISSPSIDTTAGPSVPPMTTEASVKHEAGIADLSANITVPMPLSLAGEYVATARTVVLDGFDEISRTFGSQRETG